MSGNTPQVDGWMRKNKQWAQPLEALRQILVDSPLTEEVKWRVPCYTLAGKNVAFLGALKESCTLSFVKGALLKDPKKILEKPGENTQSARVIRFTDVQQVQQLAPALKAYITQAIEIENAGQKVKFKSIDEYAICEEFQVRLDANATLKSAFKSLTPGRQRLYLMHFASAKQSATRVSRIEKCIPNILQGKGLND